MFEAGHGNPTIGFFLFFLKHRLNISYLQYCGADPCQHTEQNQIAIDSIIFMCLFLAFVSLIILPSKVKTLQIYKQTLQIAATV